MLPGRIRVHPRRHPRSSLFGFVVLLTCAPTPGASAQALAGYDFAAEPAARWEMPKRLREISGLAVSDDGRVFAHDDERAIVYELDARQGTVVKAFALADAGGKTLHGDFEGLAITGGRFYLMTSDGVLYESAEGRADEHVAPTAYDTKLGARCELEGLGADPAAGVLLLACKTPREPALAGQLTVFRWSLATHALDRASPSIAVPLAEIARAGGPPHAFSASGIDRDPRTGNYVLAAARQHALAEITPAGRVVSATRLPAARHPQAEGLAFAPDGSLFVADEGEVRGTVAVYRRK